MLKLLERQARTELEARPEPERLERDIEKLLVQLLPRGEASIECVAERLNQGPRTLQRRLAEAGLSWRGIMDQTREHLARKYLADRSLSLAEIALLLGYAEQSAFTRAFQRWTGVTPLVFRQGLSPT